MRFTYHLDFENKTSGIGLLIGERFCRGKGYGKEAAKIAFNFIFSFLRLDEISFDVPVENIPAVNMYKALNCSLTGSVREIPSHRSKKLKVERYRLSSKSFFRSKAQ